MYTDTKYQHFLPIYAKLIEHLCWKNYIYSYKWFYKTLEKKFVSDFWTKYRVLIYHTIEIDYVYFQEV